MENTFTPNKRTVYSASFPKSDEGGVEQFSRDDLSATNGGNVTYKSAIAPRSLVIQRSSFNTISGSNALAGSYSKSSRSTLHHFPLSFGALGRSVNSFAVISSTGVNAVKQSSDKEKRDMQDLNERFASYIEKVRFLEAQNKRLSDELERLKAKWGKETSQIKAMYQAELDEARKVLNEATRDKAKLEIAAASLEDLVDETKMKLNDANNLLAVSNGQIERQNRQLTDYEAELSLLRKRIETLEVDRERDKRTLITLEENLNRSRSDLDQETLMHIDAENRRQTLDEEIEFLKTIHEQEMKELAALAYRDSTAENREFWKAEMGDAMREIQIIYDDKLTSLRNELEGFYNLKLQELRNSAARHSLDTNHSKEETKRIRIQLGDLKDRFADHESRNSQLLRDLDAMKRESDAKEKELVEENENLKMELNKLRAEMESILTELQSILETKLGLELEIAAYRKLLEGEESRVGLRNLIEDFNVVDGSYLMATSGFGGIASGGTSAPSAGGAHSFGASGRMNQMLKGEMSSKTTYHKSAKGPVSVSECSQDGKFVVVDNTSSKGEDIGGWKVVRTVDANQKVEYVFGDGYTIDGNSKVKIWALGSKPDSGAENDLECSEASWGVGSNASTKIFNALGEERAAHIQKTIYV